MKAKKMQLRTAWYGLIILASLLPAVALSPWLSRQARELLLDRAILGEEIFHNELETHLYLETERLVSVLQYKSDSVARLITQDRDLDVVRNLIEKISQREAMVNTTAIYDRHAKIMLSVHRGEHASALINEDAPAFAIAMHKRVFIGSPGLLLDDHIEFLIAVPIIADDRPVGVMVSTININDFWRSIRSRMPEHHSKVYLVDGRGSLLTHLSETKHLQGDLLSNKEIVRTLLAGKGWHRRDVYEGFEGDPVFGIGTLVRNLQWGIISEIPSEAITSPIISALITLTVIVVLMHVIFGLIALTFTKRLLRPISDLAGVVKRATEGDYSRAVGASPYREIDELCTSFNTMTGEIEYREASLRKLSQAIEQAGESILMADRDGLIEYVNPAFTAMSGYSAEEIVGQPARILKNDNHDHHYYRGMLETITAGKVWKGRFVDRKKDGSAYPTMLTLSPVFEKAADGSSLAYFIAIQSDLSQLESMERQFHQAQKMEAVGAMVGGIAHNFKYFGYISASPCR